MSIQLKILFTSTGLTKTMRFTQTMSVSETLRDIKEKTNEGGRDHGLFQPPDEKIGRFGRWLRPDKTLLFYDIKAGETIEVKKKHRPLKVKLLDETIKTVMIDESEPVSEIVEMIGKKMGLRNPEEFALQYNEEDQPPKEGDTLRKKKKKDKPSQLKKLPSAEAKGWLNPTQTLVEQGLQDDSVVTLKKKYYVDDDRVDRSDPVQLHLVYVQCHESVVKGDHPVTRDEAIAFGALQCQIVWGNFDPTKHTKAFYKEKKIEELISKTHRTKGLYDPLVQEWKKLVNMSEVNAKYRYVQLCRSLKTYGITYYRGKWKPKGKKRLEELMLGVTKESIICMHPETRQVEEEHPLIHLKRWAAGPNSFTMDFGDYRDEYIIVGTPDAEAISQQLAGYIDILLKKRKDGGVVIEDDEGERATEEHVGTVHGLAIQSVTTSGYGGSWGDQGASAIMGGGGQFPGLSPGIAGMLGSVGNLVDADNAIMSMMNDLLIPLPIGQHGGKTPEQLRQELCNLNNALAAAAGALIRDAGNGLPRSELNKHAAGLASNLANLISAAKLAAAANGGDVSLLDGAKAVSDALKELMSAAGELADNPSALSKARLLEAAAALQATSAALNATAQGKYADEDSKNLLLASAAAVAAAARDLMDTSTAAVASADPGTRNAQAEGARRVEFGSAKVNATAEAVAPVAVDPTCQKYMVDAARALTDSCGGLVSGIQAGVRDPHMRSDLARAAKAATEALQQLVNSTLCAGSRTQANREAMAAAAFEIQDAVARLMSSEGNPNLIMTASRSVAVAQGQLIQAAKAVANDSEPDEKNRLFKGVADLTAAVKNMLSTASPAANDPNDKQAHKAMRDAALLVADATKHILGDISTREAALAALRTASKAVAATTTTLVADCKGVGSQLDPETFSALCDSAAQASSPTAALVAAVKDSWNSPGNPDYDNRLMHAAAALARPATGLVAVSRSCVTKLKDPQSKLSLNTAATQVTEALKKMLEALSAVKESGGHMEVDQALEGFAATAADLDYALLSAQEGTFAALPGQTRDGALALLKRAAEQLRQSADDLAESAKVSPQAMGAPAKATTSATGQIFGAAKAVASTTDERAARVKILASAKNVASAVERLINAGRAVSNNPSDAELNNNLNASLLVANEEIDKLLAAVENMGAGSEECDAAAETISKGAIESLTGFGTGSTADLQELAEELLALTKALDAAVSQVADSARNNPKALGGAANLTASTMPPILKTANNAAAKTTDAMASEGILIAGKKLADDTIEALQTAKGVTANPNDYHRDQQLSVSVKNVREDIKELLKAVDAAIPGKKELMEAQETINSASDRLVHPSAPRGNSQMHLKEVTDAARALADSVGRIVASARNFPEKLGPYSKQAADSVSEIVDASKDASSGDPASVVMLSAKKLNKDSKKIADDPHDVSNVVDGAKDVARDSLHLISSVKDAAQKEADAKARRDLILAAEKCAAVTQQLASAAKSSARHEPGAEQKLQQATSSLQTGLKALMAYNKTNGGPDFKPLLDAASAVADETGKMIEVLKVVAGKPKDSSAQAQLAVTAKSTTDAIKQVIQAAEALTFGHKECKEAIEVIQRAIGDLDAAAISATVGLLEAPVGGPSNQQCKEELITLSRDLANATGKLVGAAKENPENLGPAAKETSTIVPNVVDSAKRLAATTSDSETQQAQLQLAKNMVDAMLALVQNTRASSTNPYDKETQENLAASTRQVSSAITELVSSLKGGVMGLRQCDEAIAAVEAQLANLGKAASGPKKSYAQAGDELTKQTRELVGGIGKINSVAKNDPENVGAVTQVVANVIPQLVVAINTAITSAADEEVKQKLLNGGKEVVIAARDAISAAKNVAADPKNSSAVGLLSQQQRQVIQAIGNLLNAIREGAVLERDAEYASARIQAAIAELDSASLFAAATAGQLEVELAQGQSLDTCQNALSSGLKNALASMGNITKSTNPSGSQEVLGKTYRDFADQIEKMGRETKNVASLLGDLVAQQDVLTAGKAVAIASQAFVLASKEAMTHGDDRNAQNDFKEKGTALTTAINDLTRVSETASAEATKGIRECEKAERDINTQLTNFNNPQWPGNRNASAEEVVKAARIVAAGSGNVVSTCTNDHVGLVNAAEACNRGIVQMLADAKGAAQLTDDPKVQDDLTNAVRGTAKATLALLNAAKTAKDTPESQKNMSTLSENVADRILEVVGAARRLPGGAGLRLEEDSGDDLENLAERELMKAAKMIEDAAKRLLEARPRKVKSPGEQLNEEDINSAILDAARAITEATGALVKAATAAQRERIAKSRDPTKKHFYRKDPAWANGLISAAQAVGGTTQDLVSSANGFVKKEEDSDEDILIASAKQVAAATARLMAASRAKSDPFSDSHKNLAAASKAVAAATQSLVEAAKMAGKAINEPEEIASALDDISVMQARKEQLKRQAEMLRLEKELERARTAYTKLNKDAYAPTNLSAAPATTPGTSTRPAVVAAAPAVSASPRAAVSQPRPFGASSPFKTVSATTPVNDSSSLIDATPETNVGSSADADLSSPFFMEGINAPPSRTPTRPQPGAGIPPPVLSSPSSGISRPTVGAPTRPPVPGGGAPPPTIARPPVPGGGAPPPTIAIPPPSVGRPAGPGTPTRPPVPGGGAPPPVLASGGSGISRPPAPGGGVPPPVLPPGSGIGRPTPGPGSLTRPPVPGGGVPPPSIGRPSPVSSAGAPPSAAGRPAPVSSAGAPPSTAGRPAPVSSAGAPPALPSREDAPPLPTREDAPPLPTRDGPPPLPTREDGPPPLPGVGRLPGRLPGPGSPAPGSGVGRPASPFGARGGFAGRGRGA